MRRHKPIEELRKHLIARIKSVTTITEEQLKTFDANELEHYINVLKCIQRTALCTNCDASNDCKACKRLEVSV